MLSQLDPNRMQNGQDMARYQAGSTRRTEMARRWMPIFQSGIGDVTDRALIHWVVSLLSQDTYPCSQDTTQR